jgi:hypothetical protein
MALISGVLLDDGAIGRPVGCSTGPLLAMDDVSMARARLHEAWAIKAGRQTGKRVEIEDVDVVEVWWCERRCDLPGMQNCKRN